MHPIASMLRSGFTRLVIGLMFILFVQETRSQEFVFHWGHPSPQGNQVYGIAFINNVKGWAVTGCGSILETSDSGENWVIIRQNDSLCSDLYDILITNEGTLIVSGDQGTILRSTDEGANWSGMYLDGTGRLYDLTDIPGGGISAAGQNGRVMVSFDDGITWEDRGPGGNGYARHHLWRSANEAYVVGDDMFFRTLDGGETWSEIEVPYIFGVNEVYFTNENTGYAVQDFGYWKTTDGGDHWTYTQQVTGIDYRFRTLILDELHWFSVTFGEGSELWETTDAGLNWTEIYDRNSTGSACLVKNGDRIFFGTEIGDILYTADEGATIVNTSENLAVFPVAPVTVIGKSADGTLFANNQPNSGTANQTFYRSDDNGDSWVIPDQTPGLRWITDIAFFGNQFGLAGSYQDIRYTHDGGSSWGSAALPADYRVINFAMPAQDRFFVGTYTIASGGGGNVYRSTDQGVTWSVVGGGLPSNSLYLACVAFPDENHGYVSYDINNVSFFYSTNDGGLTWTPLTGVSINGFITDMCWLDASNGLVAVIGSDAGIHRTSDGGMHWTKVSDLQIRHFSRGAGNRIGAVYPGFNGFYESTDGGFTWTICPVPFSSVSPGGTGGVHSIQSISGGYVLGGGSNRLLVAQDVTATAVPDPVSGAKPGTVIVTISPNPLDESGFLRFSLKRSCFVEACVYDLEGNSFVLFRKDFPSGIHDVQLDTGKLKAALNQGACILTLRTPHRVSSEKFVLMP